MIKRSAGYARTNNNFVLQNITDSTIKKIDGLYLSGLCIIKNILQRGNPTKLSEYLQTELHVKDINPERLALISKEKPDRQRIIKWDVKNNNIPAKDFFYRLPEYLWKEYEYVQQLICPEVFINEITQYEVKDFEQQQVDFYLPQAFLVIEIDGHDPITWGHGTNDKKRDEHLATYGIKVIRLDTHDIAAGNDIFAQKINEIKKQIDKYYNRIEEKFCDQIKLWLQEYKKSYEDGIYVNDPRVLVTAIMRFQLLVIELLMQGHLSFTKDSQFDIILREDIDQRFIGYAIEDLFIWLENIFNLQKVTFQRPNFTYKVVTPENISVKKNTINVDFSVFKRWTDEYQIKKDIIYVRTDYLDYYMRFEEEGSRKTFKEFVPYDSFKLSTTSPFTYHITEADEKELKFFIRNLFWLKYNEFRDGQLPIINNILSRRDTVWLLPTWWGKSLCFHLACLLQPAISFVVCPIKSLMYDQIEELKDFWIHRISCITSDFDAIDKEIILDDFGKNRYFFVYISPERFQNQDFRDSIWRINNMAYAVIDEIHCLSERWHQFRTSYLCLVNTIKNIKKWCIFLWLTATASANVLNDIQNELWIEDNSNIKTLTKFQREELDFIVLDDEHKKLWLLKKQLFELEKTEGVFSDKKKSWIIFTPYANWEKWCYRLATSGLWMKENFDSKGLHEYLNIEQSELKKKVKWYSGKRPKQYDENEYGKFESYKKHVQDDFKKDVFPLLIATKAFGMGINKKNIHYTFHYGIPGSMESLYQEWWRAGRDPCVFSKTNQAKCFVLLGKENKSIKELSESIFDPNKQYEDVIEHTTKADKDSTYDVFGQLFLWKKSLDSVDVQTKLILDIYGSIKECPKDKVIIDEWKFKIENINDWEYNNIDDNDNGKVEKAIFRLMQLWLVDDYTITWWSNKRFSIMFNDLWDEGVREKLYNHILKNKSQDKIETDKAMKKFDDHVGIEKYIRILLQRSYDNYATARRTSLETVYKNCLNVTEGKIDNNEFKKILETYFRFDDDTYIMQDIADNINKNILRWIDVFYQTGNKNKGLWGLKTKDKQEDLRSMLSRLLESYNSNIGLNLISGMLRLFLNQYDDSDGQSRFENALEQLLGKEADIQNKILDQILTLGVHLDLQNRNHLAQSLVDKLNLSNEKIIWIHEALGDEYSLNVFLDTTNNKLLSSYNKLHDKFKTIG